MNEEFNGGMNSKPPRTPSPPPANLHPPPLRYPDTLGSVIEVLATEGKGLGIFATADIPPYTILLSEAPLIILQDTGTRVDPLEVSLAALAPAQRASFLSLSHFSRNPNESLARSIVYSNGYSIKNDLATGLFETASRINHSCVPNTSYVWKESTGRIVFWNRWKLMKGEEVCVDYGHKPNYLKRLYGFDCDCGGCTEAGSDLGSSSSETEDREVKGIEEVLEEDRNALDSGVGSVKELHRS